MPDTFSYIICLHNIQHDMINQIIFLDAMLGQGAAATLSQGTPKEVESIKTSSSSNHLRYRSGVQGSFAAHQDNQGSIVDFSFTASQGVIHWYL
jgi:hypothetical protein